MAIDLDQHPSIVAVHDAGEEDGTLFIAMRYIDGTTCRQCWRAGRFAPQTASSLIGQIGGALDVAHAGGLVHRDVKPANILLSHHLDHAYLVDFGLTKRIGSDSGLTRSGEFLGTLYYASPEQIEGQAVDGRTDEYSLGCVLYESLTGQPPFTGELNAIITAHLTKPVPSVTALNPNVPPAVDEVIAPATAKKAEDRYQTCGELAAAATVRSSAPGRRSTRAPTRCRSPSPVPPARATPSLVPRDTDRGVGTRRGRGERRGDDHTAARNAAGERSRDEHAAARTATRVGAARRR